MVIAEDSEALARAVIRIIIELRKKNAGRIPKGAPGLMALYEGLVVHPRIRARTESLYRQGHYEEAILNAYKSLEVMVRSKSGESGHGQSLMGRVFNENRPILRINNGSMPFDKDEQAGFNLIFMGVMTGIRNPKAHDEIDQKDPSRALEYIVLADLLARRVEESTKSP